MSDLERAVEHIFRTRAGTFRSRAQSVIALVQQDCVDRVSALIAVDGESQWLADRLRREITGDNR